MDFLKSSDEILTVSEFSRRLKACVGELVPELWVSGEISNLKTYESGHTYFTLKDSGGALNAVLFRGASKGLSFSLSEGMKILAYGEVCVYEARSNYQLVVKAALPDGRGSLSAKFEELKKKLSDEGLFDVSRKRPIPKIPSRVAVITSPSGAAVRDFISVLTRRGWKGELVVLPSKVQGAGAAEEIVSMVEYANSEKFDLLVIARGGGSLEDLWSFNEEIVARAVAGSSVPTISAVGHETDFSLCDFAADLRAETPTAAAEYISSAMIDLSARVRESFAGISGIATKRLSDLRTILDSADRALRLNSPERQINNRRISLDERSARLYSALKSAFFPLRSRLEDDFSRLRAASPEGEIRRFKEKISSIEKQIRILGVDSTLSRGFALARSPSGNFITSASELGKIGRFSLLFSDGEVPARVDGDPTKPEGNSDLPLFKNASPPSQNFDGK